MALVLIIDDSPTEVHVMKTALEKNGFETAVAQDGASGIAKARDPIGIGHRNRRDWCG